MSDSGELSGIQMPSNRSARLVRRPGRAFGRVCIWILQLPGPWRAFLNSRLILVSSIQGCSVAVSCGCSAAGSQMSSCLLSWLSVAVRRKGGRSQRGRGMPGRGAPSRSGAGRAGASGATGGGQARGGSGKAPRMSVGKPAARPGGRAGGAGRGRAGFAGPAGRAGRGRANGKGAGRAAAQGSVPGTGGAAPGRGRGRGGPQRVRQRLLQRALRQRRQQQKIRQGRRGFYVCKVRLQLFRLSLQVGPVRVTKLPRVGIRGL